MNIIINGGTGGIGLEVVKKLLIDDSNNILATGRDVSSLKDMLIRFGNLHYHKLDISVFDKESELFRKFILSVFEEVDILINMAGYLVSKDFMKFSNSEARLIMETNFFGPASLIREMKPLMAKGSHIVNISSMGGFQGSRKFAGLSYYSASKAALACLSECLAGEFYESGISLNCLALGAVQTEMLAEAFPGYKAPVSASGMAEFISDFALKGHRFFNGKVIPVAVNNP